MSLVDFAPAKNRLSRRRVRARISAPRRRRRRRRRGSERVDDAPRCSDPPSRRLATLRDYRAPADC